MPPLSVELVQRGADTPFRQQAKRRVPTVADAPQGSLIVILKDSTKSTWQFTRTDRARPGGGGHAHAHARACTQCREAPQPRMHTLTHTCPQTARVHLARLPRPSAPSPPWLARAAWIRGMQPLGTRKHTRGLRHNTEARLQTGGVCTSSSHTHARRAQGRLQRSTERVWLS